MNKAHRTLPILLLLLLIPVLLWAQEPPRFRTDDPLQVDPDRLPIPIPPERSISQIYDFLENTFLRRPDEKDIPDALNVNTLGEVPDSSWFTNRIGVRDLSLEDLATGPNQTGGPDFSRPLLIVGAKTQGITPGFTVKDAAGVTFFVKFDPPHHPQLATSSEVVATKFFHAFGYNVPENYFGFLRREDLSISPEAKLTDQEGKVRAFEESDLDRIFERIHRGPEGTTPVVASRRLPGRPVGQFRYHGTRGDDLNDLFPHEHRRELRGLRLFAAWLNHDDSRSINTLDMYDGDPGQGALRHYLIDFGSCLGSGSVQVQSKRAGYEYILEWGPILKSAASMGIWDREWRHIDYPELPAVGRFEADHFRPEAWKPEYPNPAFERMKPGDAFWAAKIIGRFSDQAVREIVKTGHYDSASEEYLIATLIERRDKIVRRYLPEVIPVDRLRIERKSDGHLLLTFEDLVTTFLPASRYAYSWHPFENRTSIAGASESSGEVAEAAIPIPQSSAQFLVLRLKRLASQQTGSVYLRRTDESWEVVGIERD